MLRPKRHPLTRRRKHPRTLLPLRSKQRRALKLLRKRRQMHDERHVQEPQRLRREQLVLARGMHG